MPLPLESAAVAAAGAAGGAASGGEQRGGFPGQAAAQTRGAASWVTLSGYLQGGGSPAKHQHPNYDPVPLATGSPQAHTGCSPSKYPGKKLLHSKQMQASLGVLKNYEDGTFSVLTTAQIFL